MSRRVGFLSHSDFSKHRAGYTHPENPDRTEHILKYLGESDIYSKLRQVEFQSSGEEWLESVHTRGYVDLVREMCRSKGEYLDGGDTYINEYSFAVANLAVGACLVAGNLVAQDKLDRAFCCTRPPGHHAEKSAGMGFCLFNNAAVLARYLQVQHKIQRIAIVDWDVHHGNGTQAIFYEDPSVFYFSVHQFPHYPGTGSEMERGANDGEGYTLNAPLHSGSGDSEFINAINETWLPAMAGFRPQFIIISAGFDAHFADPLSECKMTSGGFKTLTDIAVGAANESCAGRIVSVLEGGYDLAALSESVHQHLLGLLE